MSTAPGAAAAGDAPVSNISQKVSSCWSCRVLSGGGLILSGAYVYYAARGVMRGGGTPSLGTAAQFTFAACLAVWGIVIVADPVGKWPSKT